MAQAVERVGNSRLFHAGNPGSIPVSESSYENFPKTTPHGLVKIEFSLEDSESVEGF